MENEEIMSETALSSQSQKPKLSRLAIVSVVFGVAGPCFFGIMWIVSFLSFHDLIMASPPMTSLFCCVVAWIVGLVSGVKSFRQIKDSGGQLAGREYAVAGISVSVLWMVLVLAGLVLPALHYVNS